VAAPAAFVVIRHLLTHPEDTPAKIAKHCFLHDTTVREAMKRLKNADILGHERLLLQRLRNHPQRIRHRRYAFHAPNPDQFLSALDAPYWLSGEYAAALAGFDLVPEQAVVYVAAADLAAATQAAKDVFAKIAPESKANVVVKVADSWLYLDPDSEIVERGQLLLDYQDSRHLQILKELDFA